jgi:hypothetical protein
MVVYMPTYMFIYNIFINIQIISTIRSELVKRVVLDYNPQLHHEVGPYPMVTHVTTTSKDGVNHEHCYEIWITILDTNECDEKEHPEWRHQCDESTTCVNTEGGYYCACAGIKTRLDYLKNKQKYVYSRPTFIFLSCNPPPFLCPTLCVFIRIY